MVIRYTEPPETFLSLDELQEIKLGDEIIVWMDGRGCAATARANGLKAGALQLRYQSTNLPARFVQKYFDSAGRWCWREGEQSFQFSTGSKV